MSVGFAVVLVSGEVTVSAPCVTCSAIALIFVKGLVRTMGKCGHIFAPLQRFCASITILYHPWQLSASPPEKRPDTVGQPRSAENCPSHMLSLKAQEHREPDIARAAVLRGNRLTNSIRPLNRQDEYPCDRTSLGVEQPMLRIYVHLAPRPQVFRHPARCWPYNSISPLWLGCEAPIPQHQRTA